MKKLFLAFLCGLAMVFCAPSCLGVDDLQAFLDSLQGEEQNEDQDENEDPNGGEGGDVSSTITLDEMNTQGYAIKFAYTAQYESNNATLIYSRKGKMYRWDSIGKNSAYSYWYNRATETASEYYDGSWEEAQYYSCQQTVNNLFNEWINDCSGLLQNYGFSKTGTTTILGFPCDVWTGTYTKEGKTFGAVAYGLMTESEGNTGEFCVWNGLTLRTKVNGKLQTECTAIVVGIPDDAFTNTNDITWIK